ncbi:MAG: hypothetical protein ACK4UO_16780 [Pseudolabrys sp.]
MADTVSRDGAVPVGATTVAVPFRHGTRLLAAGLMVLALSAPAVWNGFPLIFPDTGGYLSRPFEGTLAMGRSAFYGFILYLAIPFAFWPVVVLQGAFTAWLVVLTLRALSLGDRPWLAVAAVLLLAAGTSIAWFSAQLMPDILFPAAVLALYLLAFRAECFAPWERWTLAAVVAAAIASHMAALGLCIALVPALWVAARLVRLPRPRLRYAVASLVAGLVLALVSNLVIAHSFRLTPGGSSFLFGRLIEDGIVARYLKERCPDPSLRICAYADTLPLQADDWLWGPGTAFYKLGGHEGFRDEAREIIVDSIRRYPLAHAEAALKATTEQFLRFATEVSLDDNEPTLATFAEFTPQYMNRVAAAPQQQGHIDVQALNLVHLPVAALGIAGIVAALVFRRGLAPEALALCLTVLLALVLNAAICGIFSHPVDRYQSRLVPLAPLALGLVIAARSLRRTR